jgi:cell division protein FtsA
MILILLIINGIFDKQTASCRTEPVKQCAMSDKIRTSVGLDIGSTKTAMAILQQEKDKAPEMMGFSYDQNRYLENGCVVDLEAMQSTISVCVEKIQVLKKFPISNIITNVPAPEVFTGEGETMIDLPKKQEIKQIHIQKLLDSYKSDEAEDSEMVHTFLDSFQLDNSINLANPLGMTGKKLSATVHYLSAPRSVVQSIATSIKDCKLNLSHLVLDPLAASEALITQDEIELGVLLIDIGGSQTNMVALKGRKTHIFSPLLLGGESVTSDISYGLRTSMRDAERIKLKYGHALPALAKDDHFVEVPALGGDKTVNASITPHRLAEIINPRIDEIFEMLADTFHKTFQNDHFTAGFILTGGGSLLPGTSEIAEKHLQLPMIRGNLRNITGMTDLAPVPLQAAAVGLALYGLKYPVNRVWGQGNQGSFTYLTKKLFNWLGGDQNQ